MCACTCVVTQHMSSNTQNKPSQADQGIGRKEGSGEKSRKGDGKYSTISVKNNICNISKEIKDFTKSTKPLLGLPLLRTSPAFLIMLCISSLVQTFTTI